MIAGAIFKMVSVGVIKIRTNRFGTARHTLVQSTPNTKAVSRAYFRTALKYLQMGKCTD